MRVYAAGERQRSGVHTLDIAPMAHVGQKANCPADWIQENGEPRQFTITFRDGSAEVSDEIGRYLVAHKLARRTALIVPATVA